MAFFFYYQKKATCSYSFDHEFFRNEEKFKKRFCGCIDKRGSSLFIYFAFRKLHFEFRQSKYLYDTPTFCIVCINTRQEQ